MFSLPVDTGGASVGRGLRMNWHCLETCGSSPSEATFLSTGGMLASHRWKAECLT